MTGLFVKKAFFDGWDNLLFLILLNIGIVIIIAVGAYLPILFGEAWQATLLSLLLALILLSIYEGGTSRLASEMASYQRPEIRSLFSAMRESLPASLLFGVINGAHLLLLSFVVPFYYSMGGVVGLGALSLVFWISLAWWLASQWFFPVLIQLPGNFKTVVKKCFILFFDNPGFTIFMAFHTLFTFLISVVTALLMPGLVSIHLARQGAMRLLMHKYDYLEEHPEADRKEIPWEALLIEERELIGHRTLKGMIFPWKD
jgi:hypothetical protein